MKLPLWRRRQDDDLDDEIESHLQMAIRDRVERGETIECATTAAQREFGNVTRVKEVTREMWGWLWLEQFWQDVRYATRICRRAPVFTATAVLSMTLGIGANTAIFTLLDAVVFKRLPAPEPERLVNFGNRDDPGGTALYAYRDYLHLRDQPAVLAGLAARTVLTNWPIKRGTATGAVSLTGVTSSYFDVLGIRAALGRTITPADETIPGNAVVMLGHEYWQRQFGGDPRVLGQLVLLANRPFTIVGIAPASFPGLNLGVPDELLVPLTAIDWDVNDPKDASFQLIGRLAGGVQPRYAEVVLTAALQRMHETTAAMLTWRNPLNRRLYVTRAIALSPGNRGVPEGLREQFSRPLLALMALVLLVLAIACANVANLLLARAGARQREIDVRVALGAGRGRLLRQLLTESLLLAGVGSLFGVLVAWAGCRWIVATLSLGDGRTPLLHVAPDLRALGFTAGLSTLTGLAFGLAPVIRALAPTAARSTHEASSPADGPTASNRLRRGLIVAQVGLAVILLATAGLFVQTLWNLHHLGTGMDRARVVLFKVMTPSLNDAGTARRNQLRVQLQERIKAIPGVRAAAVSMQQGFYPGFTAPVIIEDRSPDPEPPKASFNLVTSRYFEALGIPVVRGRVWSHKDDADPPEVPPAIINQALSQALFGDGDPIGRRIRASGTSFQIVGVAQDARYFDLRQPPQPTVFGVASARPAAISAIYVRTYDEPSTIVPAVRRALEASYGIDGIAHAQTLEKYTAEATSQDRIVAGLSGVLGGIASLLTAVGLYGVMAYSVARRTREFGIRIALGAGRADILRLVMGEVLILTMAGLAIGLMSTPAVMRLTSSLLFGISPTDATTIAAAAIAMCAIAALAGYVPARRAMSSSPVTALRRE